MTEKKFRKPRPLHPFPFVAGCRPIPFDHDSIEPAPLSKAQINILDQLRNGARILFDIEHKRALLYSFKRGVEHLGEVTVRSLSKLLKNGWLTVCGREGRLIHYSLAY